MDDSVPTTSNPTDSPPAPRWTMTRALVSAAVFGFIGQAIGRWLGRHVPNKVAEPALRWSMGSFWAVLAAYSSLKASAMERGETIAESPTAEPAPEKKTEPAIVPNAKAPLSLVEVETVKNHGQVQSVPQLELAAK